jgi:non-lysosomal glucosylceramidase
MFRPESDFATGGISRRDFLCISGLGVAGVAAGLALPGRSEAASPMSDHTQLVPQDKGFSHEWLEALYRRGEPQWFRGDELRYIGMPIGGACCGQVYLGGDGRLWWWDIFNRPPRAEFDQDAGPRYARPVAFDQSLAQGFAMRIETKGRDPVHRTLDRDGFADVSFRGAWPMGFVRYQDPQVPVAVDLEAFSPFVPLNFADSSIPTTVLRFTLHNTSHEAIRVSLAGWLENGVCRVSGRDAAGVWWNRSSHDPGKMRMLLCGADERFADEADYGTMGLALLGDDDGDYVNPLIDSVRPARGAFEQTDAEHAAPPMAKPLVGSVVRRVTLAPGESRTITFAVVWHFPSVQVAADDGWKSPPWYRIRDVQNLKRHYAPRYEDAKAVAADLAERMSDLYAQTRLWHDTWYDSTLPHWFLDRSFVTLDCLATHTCHQFDNGRFYGWEGTYVCAGTCTHVWSYAQGLARIFPELERDHRERVDFGIALMPNGRMSYRAEASMPAWATDGQLGTILRVYREHTMSADDAFLRRIWPNVRKSLEYVIDLLDADRDGLLDGPQPNTLDSTWYGRIAWISSMYLAALAACEVMGREVGDDAFADQCNGILASGKAKLVSDLFRGDLGYFIHDTDPAHPEAINTNIGCHIDQVLGQWWASQLALPRVIDHEHASTALRALWRHNLTPDAGGYRDRFTAIRGGRWYAMRGEAGLLMCTWPHGGAEQAPGAGDKPAFVGYFNECMTGFEYQVAGHMVAEGLVEKGLAICRVIHDRYHPAKRNPYNEIECSNHYSRAMASYGVFVALCGYEHHGPRGRIGFAPRLNPEDFRAPFTAAEGWGTFRQQREGSQQQQTLDIKWGQVRLSRFTCELPEGVSARACRASIADQPTPCRLEQTGRRAEVVFDEAHILEAGQSLQMTIAW